MHAVPDEKICWIRYEKSDDDRGERVYEIEAGELYDERRQDDPKRAQGIIGYQQ
jgi:hypothetical protein